MKHTVVLGMSAFVWLVAACQPDTACHGGRVMTNGTCVFAPPSMDSGAPGSNTGDSGGQGNDKDASAISDGGGMDAGDASHEAGAADAGGGDASGPGAEAGLDSGTLDSGADAGADAGGDASTPPIPEAPYCDARVALTDEEKYGQACNPADDPSMCGTLTCQTGANYCTKGCTVGDACSCPGGFACVSFGGPATACVPTWGRTCTSDANCRAQAPLCFKGPNFCTSVCDPEVAKTCPDTWVCTVTPGGNFCLEP